MPNSCLQILQKSKKSAFPSGCIFGILLSRRLNYRPKKKNPLFLVEQDLKQAKEQAKEKNRQIMIKKITNSQKSKAWNGQPEGIAKKAIILDHSQELSSCPVEIKLFGIYLRMYFLNTFTSETELSIEKNSFLIDEGLKWVKYRLKK